MGEKSLSYWLSSQTLSYSKIGIVSKIIAAFALCDSFLNSVRLEILRLLFSLFSLFSILISLFSHIVPLFSFPFSFLFLGVILAVVECFGTLQWWARRSHCESS